MQGSRFDTMARLLSERPSRRGLLRGGVTAVAAVLALARGDAAETRHARTPLGGACRQLNQCLHHALAPLGRRSRPSRQGVYCADNGFRYDGPLNCCRYGGGTCERDEHCCGSRHFCRNRVCTYLR